MRISMEMSGFTAARADKLRKAMGKKDSDLIAAQRRDFIEGAVANGYDRRMLEGLWSDIEAFAKYAFNKSHAAAYAMISYQTAYLKAHYPGEFMAAVLSSYSGKTEDIVKYVASCKRSGIAVLPPDVNSSGADFTAVPEGIRFGLAGVRNVGEGVVAAIVAERKAGGPFTSLQDFCGRVQCRSLNKKGMESLVKAGAFDSTGYTRKHLMSMLDEAVDTAIKRQRDRENGQIGLFEMDGVDHGFQDSAPRPTEDEWDKTMKLAFEKEMLGMYVSDHPLREIAEVVEHARTLSLGDGETIADGTTGWFAGILTKVDRVVTKKGKLKIDYTIEDLDGLMAGVLFGNVYTRYEPLFIEDAIVRIKAKVESSDRGTNLSTIEVQPLDQDGVFRRAPGVLMVTAGYALSDEATLATFKATLARHPGPDSVQVEVNGNGTRKVLQLPETYRVDKTDTRLHAELRELLGTEAIKEI
jgi:DNA polymerase-3 subunit alpha